MFDDWLIRMKDSQRNDLTGNRLWIDNVEHFPGVMTESCSYICDKNIPLSMLKVIVYENGLAYEVQETKYVWTPAHIEAEYSNEYLTLREQKYITKDDVLACFYNITNVSHETRKITIKIETMLHFAQQQFRTLYNPGFIEEDNIGKHSVSFELSADCIARNVLRTIVPVYATFFCPKGRVCEENDSFLLQYELSPGEEERFTVLSTFSHVDESDKLLKLLKTGLTKLNPNSNEMALRGWFAQNVPSFSCSDPLLEKMYYYRWFLVYKNLIAPDIYPFSDFCCYEGKDRYSLVCSASSAFHIRELRWLRAVCYVEAEMRTLAKMQIQYGASKGRGRDVYVNDIPNAIWETYCMMPKDSSKDIAAHWEKIKQNVDYYASSKYLMDDIVLPTVIGSWRTAAEYQPSFFEFTEPPWDHTKSNPFGNERDTRLHRVDDAVYHCQNLEAVAEFAKVMQNDEIAAEYSERSKRVLDSIEKYMWDDSTGFYYDLQTKTKRKALQSKCFDGFLPARVISDKAKGDKLFTHLKTEFDTPWPIPTVGTDCPAFSQNSKWRCGPNADADNEYQYVCCWNGPSWNLSNSLIIDCLGGYIQKHGTIEYNPLFAELLNKWCLEQCPDPSAFPNTCEHYDSFTGKALSTVKDYFHSTFIDIIIRRVVGIEISQEDCIACSPVDIGLDFFHIENVPFKGHLITITWSKNPSPNYRLICDDMLLFEADSLTPFTVVL